MRILHLVDEPCDSGIVQYALAAASGLAQRGHPTVVWGKAGAYPLQEAARRSLETAAFARPWLELAALRRLLRERDIQILVAHTGSSHTVALAATAGLRSGPCVLRTRGDARPMRRRPGARILWRRTRGFIAANTRILAEHCRLHPRAKLPCAVIYEGQEDFGPVVPPFNGAPTVGIVGRLDPIKGHHDFLSAAALAHQQLPDARFLIIGRQENIQAQDLEKRAHKLGLSGRVELTGHVPDVRPWMRRCHVGVIASTGSEAVSRVAVEWMSAARPLIATAVGCLPEYVADGQTGFLTPPGRPQALAERLAKLISDVFLRERMGRAGRSRYETLFTPARFLDQTEQFYEQILHAVSSR